MVSHWSLGDSKFPHVYRTLLSVPADLNNAVGLDGLSFFSYFNLLYNSQWITFPAQSCLVLCNFCASLLHLLIISLIVSSIKKKSSMSRAITVIGTENGESCRVMTKV